MTKLLSGVYIRDMNLNHWGSERANTVEQGYAGVGVGTCIENNAVVGEPYFLHFINQLAFNVTLVVGQLYRWILALQVVEKCIESGLAIDVWLSTSQQIEIWPIDNLNFHNSHDLVIFVSFIHVLSSRNHLRACKGCI